MQQPDDMAALYKQIPFPYSLPLFRAIGEPPSVLEPPQSFPQLNCRSIRNPLVKANLPSLLYEFYSSISRHTFRPSTGPSALQISASSFMPLGSPLPPACFPARGSEPPLLPTPHNSTPWLSPRQIAGYTAPWPPQRLPSCPA